MDKFIKQLAEHEERGGATPDGSVVTWIRLDCGEFFADVCGLLGSTSTARCGSVAISDGVVRAGGRRCENRTLVVCRTTRDASVWKSALSRYTRNFCRKFTVTNRHMSNVFGQYRRVFITHDSYYESCRQLAAFVYSRSYAALFSLDCRLLRAPPSSITVVPTLELETINRLSYEMEAVVMNYRPNHHTFTVDGTLYVSDRSYEYFYHTVYSERDVENNGFCRLAVIVEYPTDDASFYRTCVQKFVSWTTAGRARPLDILLVARGAKFVRDVLAVLTEFYGAECGVNESREVLAAVE